jgi:hypothetical protein
MPLVYGQLGMSRVKRRRMSGRVKKIAREPWPMSKEP